MKTENVVKFPRSAVLECSACGAPGQGSCDCGAPYVSAGKRAAKAVAASPEKSDRAIAAELGVGTMTVSRARKSTVPSGTVEARTGRDGKKRKMPAPTLILPTEEEAEEEHQQTLYDQACRFLELMTGETRQRFFAHIKRKYRHD